MASFTIRQPTVMRNAPCAGLRANAPPTAPRTSAPTIVRIAHGAFMTTLPRFCAHHLPSTWYSNPLPSYYQRCSHTAVSRARGRRFIAPPATGKRGSRAAIRHETVEFAPRPPEGVEIDRPVDAGAAPAIVVLPKAPLAGAKPGGQEDAARPERLAREVALQ